MLAEEPDVRKALVRFREGLGGNLRGAPSLLDLRLIRQVVAATAKWPISSVLTIRVPGARCGLVTRPGMAKQASPNQGGSRLPHSTSWPPRLLLLLALFKIRISTKAASRAGRRSR